MICLILFAFAIACGKPKTTAVVLVQPEAQILEGSLSLDGSAASTGTLRVEVLDEEEQPIPGVIVKIKCTEQGLFIDKALETDRHGKGTILSLPPCGYRLRALFDGTDTVSLKNGEFNSEVQHLR